MVIITLIPLSIIKVKYIETKVRYAQAKIDKGLPVGHPKRPTCQATQKWSECQMTKSKAIHTISHDFIPKNDHVNKK